MKKYSDIISGAVLFVLAAVYYAMATQIKQYNSGLPGIVTSDFIPKVYGVAVMVLSAILIFRGIRDLKKAQVQETGEAEDRKRFPIDPAIVPFIMEKKGLTPEEMDTLMNKKSGLLGLCGFTDMRDVHKEIENGNKKAELALNMLVRSIKKTLGAYFFLLGGKVDALVFTAGIGENDDIVRAKVCEGLEELGVRLNLEVNGTRKPGARTISTPDSKIKVLISPTNEELQIAQATMEVLA